MPLDLTLDTFYRIVLFFFSPIKFALPFTIAGIFFLRKREFFVALTCSALSSFVCIFLKSLWKVPLTFKSGWAFPSGHTMHAIMFYGMLLCYFRSPWLVVFFLAMLLANSFAMVHFGYHTWYDISGGVVFGSLLLIAVNVFLKVFKDDEKLLAFLTCCIGAFVIYYFQTKGYEFAWMARPLGVAMAVFVAVYYSVISSQVSLGNIICCAVAIALQLSIKFIPALGFYWMIALYFSMLGFSIIVLPYFVNNKLQIK